MLNIGQYSRRLMPLQIPPWVPTWLVSLFLYLLCLFSLPLPPSLPFPIPPLPELLSVSFPLLKKLTGRMAASFALCYQVYAATLPTYAQTCLNYAEHVSSFCNDFLPSFPFFFFFFWEKEIFAQANTNPTGDLVTASPFDFYPESEWRDDLALGAAELYLFYLPLILSFLLAITEIEKKKKSEREWHR